MKIPSHPETAFYFLGFLFGILFLIITPPFQAPDETAHFYRSFQISQGALKTDALPSSVVLAPSKFNHLPFHPEQKTSFKEIYSLLRLPLDPQVTAKINSIAFPPIAYLPQALGMKLGEVLGCSPLILMYLGRFFNFITWFFLVWFAVKCTPIFKWLFCLLALSPMSLFEAASLSRDAFVNGSAFLLIALIFYHAFGNGRNLKNRDLFLLMIMMFLVSVPKAVYGVIGLLFLLIPITKVGSRKKYYAWFFLIMSLTLSLILVGEYYFLRNRSAPSSFMGWNERLDFILDHPLGFLKSFIHTLWINGGEYVRMFIGVLGWLDTPLPGLVWNLYGVILILVALLENDPNITVNRRAKMVALVSLGLGTCFILGAMYLAMAPIDGVIQGVQGRYFIPLAPLFFLLLYNQRIRIQPAPGNLLGMMVLSTSLIVLSASCHTLLSRYYF